MSNELKDIAVKLNGYNEKGWQIIRAKKADGKWFLVIEEIEPAKDMEATDGSIES